MQLRYIKIFKNRHLWLCFIAIFLLVGASQVARAAALPCSVGALDTHLNSLSTGNAKDYVAESLAIIDDTLNCLRSSCPTSGFLKSYDNKDIDLCGGELTLTCGAIGGGTPYGDTARDACTLCHFANNMDSNGETRSFNPYTGELGEILQLGGSGDAKLNDAINNAKSHIPNIIQNKKDQEKFESIPVIGWMYQGLETLGSFMTDVSRTVKDLIEGNFGEILKGIANFFVGIIKILSGILIWAINPQTYGGLSTNGGVIAVWNFMRELVNIILVLGVVIIAIATILRIQPYNAKSLLWKLIIIALLVNFSLVLTGMVVDVFNFLSVYFINLGVNQNQNMDQIISSSFGYDKMVTSMANPQFSGGTSNITTSWDGASMGLGTFLIIAFILIVAGIVSVIAIFAGFVSLLIRAFMIFFCLAVSPFAFAAWVFPATQKFWNMWSSQLIKWLSFSVIFSIMLYLGISVMQAGPISAIGGGGGNVGFISGIIQTLLFSTFLVGGLFVALQGGSTVSQKIMSEGGKLAQSVGAWAGRAGVQAVARSQSYQNIANRLATNTSPTLNRLGINRLGTSMLRNTGRVLAEQGRRIDQGIEPIRENTDALRAGFSSTNNSLAKLKYLSALIDGGNNLNSSEISQYLSFAHLYKGSPEVNKIEKAIPSLKKGGHIPPDELIGQLLSAYQNSDSKILGASLIQDILDRRPGEFDAIIGTLIRKMADVKLLNNLILSISSSKRVEICDKISKKLSGGTSSLDAWLQVASNNPNLYSQIQNPDSNRAPYVSTIKQFFNIP